MSISNILYRLQCKHVAPGPPTLVNGSLICAWCRVREPITGVETYEWKATCITKPCKYARWAGLSKHNAGIFAAGHARHNPTHEIVVEYTENPEAVKTAKRYAEYARWAGKELRAES